MKVIILLVCSLYLVKGYPTLDDATICKQSKCKIEDDCRCSSQDNPIYNIDDPAPQVSYFVLRFYKFTNYLLQLIALTVSESVVTTLYHDYLERLLYGRTNPDGNSIGATFYVNHEYTDYELVQQLYLHGYEIGVHSIT